MTFTEEFEQLFEDSDIMKISGAVGMRTNDGKISFCLGLEQKYINPEFYTISKLDQYWATRFPWTVEVTGFSDIPYLKVTFDYKLNEKGELYVLDTLCSKNSLEIPDEYFSKSEVDIDLTVHFNKEPNIIVIDYRTEI